MQTVADLWILNSSLPSHILKISYTECCSEYFFAFASLSPDFKGGIFSKEANICRCTLMEVVADLLWQVISCIFPLSWQQCLARVSDIFPQKDMSVLRKCTDPNMGVWMFLYYTCIATKEWMKLALNSLKVNFLQRCWFWFWLRNLLTRYLTFFVLKILSKGTPNYCDTKLTSIPVMDFIKMFMRNQVLHIVSGPKINLAPTWIVYYAGFRLCYRFWSF